MHVSCNFQHDELEYEDIHKTLYSCAQIRGRRYAAQWQRQGSSALTTVSVLQVCQMLVLEIQVDSHSQVYLEQKSSGVHPSSPHLPPM